jgi:hypothetical protein
MTVREFLHLPPPPSTFSTLADASQYLRRQWDALNPMRRGKIECVTELTLTANAATTVLTDNRLSVQSVVTFDPKTANAATEIHGGTMYVLTANRGTGAWTITHANNATVDRQFQVSIIG